MPVTATPEYRALQRDTSNDIIRHDTRRGDGEFTAAATHARRAGIGRRRMAELAVAAGEYPRAAADWLSAAACYLLCDDGGAMAECVARARELADAGRIPADRRDLWHALAEREAELQRLLATPATTSAGAPESPLPAAQP